MIYAYPIDRHSQLSTLLDELVDVLRHENSYTYTLLKESTIDKTVIIELSGIRLRLSGRENDSYHLDIGQVQILELPNFRTNSKVLREIIHGTITLDKAIADEKIFIQGELSDLLNMYKLTLCLLSDAVFSYRLRDLWRKFLVIWQEDLRYEHIPSFQNQNPKFDAFIQNIPKSVLNI